MDSVEKYCSAMNNLEVSKADPIAPLHSVSESSACIQVLLADESASSRDSALALLNAEGYSVLLAEDGFEALALVVQHRPAVVLADVMLPRLDGYQLCCLIRSNSDYRDTPVIMLSSIDGLLDQTRADMVGSDAHVCRVHMATQLTDVVNALTP